MVEIFGHDDDGDGNCVIVTNGGDGETESCSCPAGPAGPAGSDGLDGPVGPVGPVGPAGPAAASSGEGASESVCTLCTQRYNKRDRVLPILRIV